MTRIELYTGQVSKAALWVTRYSDSWWWWIDVI